MNIDFQSNWMSYVNGSILINKINIPGTHDAATGTLIRFIESMGALPGAKIIDVVDRWSALGKTQKYTIEKQLNAGVRLLDLRLKYRDGDLSLFHGPDGIKECDCRTTFDKVINDVRTFLNQHNTETVLMLVRCENDESDEFRTALQKKIDILEQENLIYTKHAFPKLDDVRGKMVFINGVKDFKIEAIQYGKQFDIEDEYDVTSQSKISIVEAALKKAEQKGIVADKGNIIYTSTNPIENHKLLALESVEEWANEINSFISEYPFKKKEYGWFFMDYVNEELARKIYSTNFEKTPYISELYAVSSIDGKKAKERLVELGYEVIDNVDFNGMAGRNYIYLGCKRTSDPSKAITGIVAQYYDDTNDDMGITYDGDDYIAVTGEYQFSHAKAFDFNDIAGLIHGSAKYIYLYYTKSQKTGKKPIKDIWVKVNNAKEPEGYHIVKFFKEGTNAEFTKGTGGSSDIFMFYSRKTSEHPETIRYISELYAESNTDRERARELLKAKGYELVSEIDLNMDTGRNYIYLGCKYTEDPEQAITEIISEYYSSKNERTVVSYQGASFTAVKGEYKFSSTDMFDFNDVAGPIHGKAKYIYLYCTRSKERGRKPIIDINVKLNNTTAENGYKNVINFEEGNVAEFTKGTGGKTDIYMFYKTLE